MCLAKMTRNFSKINKVCGEDSLITFCEHLTAISRNENYLVIFHSHLFLSAFLYLLLSILPLAEFVLGKCSGFPINIMNKNVKYSQNMFR